MEQKPISEKHSETSELLQDIQEGVKLPEDKVYSESKSISEMTQDEAQNYIKELEDDYRKKVALQSGITLEKIQIDGEILNLRTKLNALKGTQEAADRDVKIISSLLRSAKTHYFQHKG